jgi:PPOX class probable F420-dependent enzyme
VRKNLAVTELGDLVDLPLIAILATYRSDGTVLLSPVWHEYRDGGFNVVTFKNDVKARHLRRDARAVLVVAEAFPPFRGVEITCEARLLHDGVHEALERMAIRYLGEEKGPAYADFIPASLLVRLEPGKLRTWDYSDNWASFGLTTS